MSDKVFDAYYREIFADVSIDREEGEDIKQKFLDFNPPPDKILALRASVFRVGSEFLSSDVDWNTSLLKTMNSIINILETNCMLPKPIEDEDDSFETDAVESKYREILGDLSVDREESQELRDFFNNTPKGMLKWTRATAFRIAIEFLSKEDKKSNVALLRCVNSIVHAFELTCLMPKPYTLKTEPFNMEVGISEAVQHLWDLDVNRAAANRDYKINVQGGKKPYQKQDTASEPLFDFVNTRNLFNRQTYKAFIALLDNYSAQVGVSEKISREERQENWNFINAIMQTGPMQFCHKYCCAHDPDVPTGTDDFKKLLHEVWFDMYNRSRGGRPDSSGFEHVFVGEIKNGEISGFHNWIQFYLEERKGNADYRGYIKPRNRNSARTDSDDSILSLQFIWNGCEKFVGTSFIGVSPEFEMALYTMCFLIGEKSNWIELNTGTDIFELEVKVYTMAKRKIGTSYVEAKGHYEE